MQIEKQAYFDLLNSDLQNYKKVIRPLKTDHPLSREFGPWIANYEKENLAITDRFIPPYITSHTHGRAIYAGLKTFIDDIKPKSVLDLGCATGELLYEIKKIDNSIKLYGCTIHVGEVFLCEELYGINIIPADMREIDQYFNADSLDLIIAHCSLHFLKEEDRIEVAQKSRDLLVKNRHFFVVNYKRIGETGLNANIEGLELVKEYDGFMGEALLYRKV
jgi:SAM-dependent methyltransferase